MSCASFSGTAASFSDFASHSPARQPPIRACQTPPARTASHRGRPTPSRPCPLKRICGLSVPSPPALPAYADRPSLGRSRRGASFSGTAWVVASTSSSARVAGLAAPLLSPVQRARRPTITRIGFNPCAARRLDAHVEALPFCFENFQPLSMKVPRHHTSSSTVKLQASFPRFVSRSVSLIVTTVASSRSYSQLSASFRMDASFVLAPQRSMPLLGRCSCLVGVCFPFVFAAAVCGFSRC